MKKFLNKVIPRKLYSIYHFLLAISAATVYGFPAKKMIVIGITGTKGKTSTANFIWSTLNAGGLKTGIITTANIRIGNEESMNYFHMTMPGRFAIQKLMSDMVKAGCTHCVVETTSEGIQQYRHVGVYYDVGVFTNLTPEHLPSHGGSFEVYKGMKKKMFKTISSHKKIINGKNIEKVIIANADSEHAADFLAYDADKKFTFSLKNKADYVAQNIQDSHDGVSFNVTNTHIPAVQFKLSIPGTFNVYNALPAIIISRHAEIPDDVIAEGLSNLKLIPGRMEKIDVGQDFTVFVDYAHEKQSMTGVMQTAQNMRQPGKKIIVLLGAEGGGRDKAKRADMGEVVGKMADYVICSNVDPYEDDPTQIVEDIAVVAEKFGKVRGQDLFVIEDRRAGIAKSLLLAKIGDVVIITGKGAEQSMIIGGVSRPWDDRKVVREELEKIIK